MKDPIETTPKNDDSDKPGSGLVGFACYAICGVGVGAFIMALMALDGPVGNYVGAGVCLIASALSFGLLLNACLRN